MSGRKDYSIAFSALRVAQRAAQQQLRLATRARRTRERIKANEREAKRKVQEALAEAKARREERRKISMQNIDAARDRNQSKRERLKQSSVRNVKNQAEQQIRKTESQIEETNRTAKKEASAMQATADHRQLIVDQLSNAEQLIARATELGLEVGIWAKEAGEITRMAENTDVLASTRLEALIGQLGDCCRNQELLNKEFAASLEKLVGWREVLGNDEDVKHFAHRDAENWNETIDSIIGHLSAQSDVSQALRSAQELVSQAESIQSKAGEISDRFHHRNQVLVDITESLKEVGFFVQDPEYADPNSPGGAVIIRANRGDQIMTAKVGLDEKVQSDWQGIGGEYCTSAFFDYVKAMGNKGIEVIPENFELNPRLIQKGEKELPDSGHQRRSGGDQN